VVLLRKLMVITIPIITLILFTLVMLSGEFLKQPIGKDDDIPQAIEELKKTIQQEEWSQVSKKTDELEKMWKKIAVRVQFSSERDEINYFSMNIARLRGAIMAENKPEALIEISEAYEHWDELGN